MDLTRQLIRFDEGEKHLPYQDSDGIWTIADGHNLQANGLPAGICTDAPDGLPYPDCLSFIRNRGGLTQPEIDALYAHDLDENGAWIQAKPWWPSVDPVRQAALMDMAFNLGPARAQAFTGFYGLVAIQDWPAASDDLAKTLVARQLPKRYGRLIQILRTGTAAGVIPGVQA